jgi:hypothetical protein
MAEIVEEESYSKLNKLIYNFAEYYYSKNKYVEINKSTFPNLKSFTSIWGIRHLDISSYTSNELDSIEVYVDTLCISPSIYDERNRVGRLFWGNPYIIVK